MAFTVLDFEGTGNLTSVPAAAKRPELRSAVAKEFDGLKGLLTDYIAALQKAYAVPEVKEPK